MDEGRGEKEDARRYMKKKKKETRVTTVIPIKLNNRLGTTSPTTQRHTKRTNLDISRKMHTTSSNKHNIET